MKLVLLLQCNSSASVNNRNTAFILQNNPPGSCNIVLCCCFLLLLFLCQWNNEGTAFFCLFFFQAKLLFLWTWPRRQLTWNNNKRGEGGGCKHGQINNRNRWNNVSGELLGWLGWESGWFLSTGARWVTCDSLCFNLTVLSSFVFQVYTSVYFCGHIFFLVAFLIMPYLRKVLVPKEERSQLKQD